MATPEGVGAGRARTEGADVRVRPGAEGVTGKRARLIRNVAPGIHRLEHAYVNCYIIEDAGAMTVVDAALPQTWRYLMAALRHLGRRPEQIEALVLTHAHFDHVGFAERARTELGVPVWAHPSDVRLATNPYRYARERTPFLYPLRFPRSIPVLAAMAGAGALRVPGVQDVSSLPVDGILDVPGNPTVVFSPGHTMGHVALHLGSRDALLTGDALVTLDPYTARQGPHIVAGAATADSEMALRSLRALATTGAGTVLPGHGEPWKKGIESAVDAALAAGPS